MAFLVLFSCWKVPFLLCLPEFLSTSIVIAIDQTTLASYPDNCRSLLTGLIACSFSVVKQPLKYTNQISLQGPLASRMLKIKSAEDAMPDLQPHLKHSSTSTHSVSSSQMVFFLSGAPGRHQAHWLPRVSPTDTLSLFVWNGGLPIWVCHTLWPRCFGQQDASTPNQCPQFSSCSNYYPVHCVVEVPGCSTVSQVHSDTGHQGGSFYNYGGERKQGKWQQEQKRPMSSALQVAQLKCESQASQPYYWAQAQTCRKANKSLSRDNKCWKHSIAYSAAWTDQQSRVLGSSLKSGTITLLHTARTSPGPCVQGPSVGQGSRGQGRSTCFASDGSGLESWLC